MNLQLLTILKIIIKLFDKIVPKTCTNFIEVLKRQIYGVGSCDKQTPYIPVAWEETPHFIPSLLGKNIDSVLIGLIVPSLYTALMPYW